MRIIAPLLIAALACACAPTLIPGTSVEDSAENRQVLEFLNKYRRAVVDKNLDGVVGLCAQDYFEDNGTIEQGDDYGITQLREKLARALGQTKEIQLEIIVQTIERDQAQPKAPIRVVYRYNQRALLTVPAGDKWITVSDVNRLVLRGDDAGGYQILSGL